jgi:hypothetical protein
MGIMLTYITNGEGWDRIRIMKIRKDGNRGNWNIMCVKYPSRNEHY